MNGFLLERADVPSDWTEVDVDDHPTEVPGIEDLDTTLVSAFFQGGDLGPYLGHMLLITESESDARLAFEAIEEELDSADILDGISEEVREWETRPQPFATLGDETFAFRAVGDTGLLPVMADMVTTRQGRFVSLVIYAEVIAVDSEDTEDFAQTAMDNLLEEGD